VSERVLRSRHDCVGSFQSQHTLNLQLHPHMKPIPLSAVGRPPAFTQPPTCPACPAAPAGIEAWCPLAAAPPQQPVGCSQVLQAPAGQAGRGRQGSGSHGRQGRLKMAGQAGQPRLGFHSMAVHLRRWKPTLTGPINTCTVLHCTAGTACTAWPTPACPHPGSPPAQQSRPPAPPGRQTGRPSAAPGAPAASQSGACSIFDCQGEGAGRSRVRAASHAVDIVAHRRLFAGGGQTGTQPYPQPQPSNSNTSPTLLMPSTHSARHLAPYEEGSSANFAKLSWQGRLRPYLWM
jgi:hypothetical protein